MQGKPFFWETPEREGKSAWHDRGSLKPEEQEMALDPEKN
jgi:hypothetical protein